MPLEIGRGTNPERAEDIVRSLDFLGQMPETGRWIVKLASQVSSHIFGDVWAAIAVGTICRRSQGSATVITWGNSTWPPGSQNSAFAQSLAGLTAMQMAGTVVTDVISSPIDREEVERTISLANGGILETSGGQTRTLVEFDPQQPLARVLQEEPGSRDNSTAQLASQRRLFRHLVLNFRNALEVGAIVQQVKPVDMGVAAHLTTFLSELHDNSLEHGRIISGPDPAQRSIQFVRLRKHIAKNRDDIRARATSIEPLRHYVEEVRLGSGTQALMEATVSDYGPGIVDHFLNSSAGVNYRNADRRELLDQLLLTKVTSKSSDPDAGLGTQRALSAAKGMSGFVSLRTAEFWLAQSYASPDAPLQLVDMRGEALAKVAGTHWQFLWPQRF